MSHPGPGEFPRKDLSVEEAHVLFVRRRAEGDEISIEEFAAGFPKIAEQILLYHSALQISRERSTGGQAADALKGMLDRWDSLGLGPGSVLGPYVLREKLGGGGFGVVYLADQTKPIRRQVAVKILRLSGADAEMIARFKSEGQALALMTHPFVAKVHDAGVSDAGVPYLVMEFIRGKPIHRHCDEGRLPVEDRLRLFVRVCEGVHHAHLKGIIHRDIKPGNILVSATDQGEPVPRVIDFGLAKIASGPVGADAPRTVPGQFWGTLIYASPEQLGIGPGDIDARTDIYSLGLVLYELLAGTPAIPPDVPPEAAFSEVHRIRGEDALPAPSTFIGKLGDRAREAAERRQTTPAALRRRLRGDLNRIVLKALQKDRSLRYDSALEFARDIERHLRHEPVLAASPGAIYRAGKFVRRHRAAAAGALAVLVIALCFLGLWWARSERRFHDAERDARTAVSEGQFERAISHLSILKEGWPGRAETARLGAEVSRGMLDSARASWKEYETRWAAAADLRDRWAAERERPPSWRPSWERGDEFRLWQEYGQIREGISQHYSVAASLLSRALEVTPPTSMETAEIRSLLAEIYFSIRQEVRNLNPVLDLSNHFSAMVRIQGAGRFARLVDGPETIRIDSEPPGGDAYCFRYVERADEGRWLPLPFHPAKGLVGKPFLRIREVWAKDLSPFEPGDRILEVAGKAAEVPGDVARILAEKAPIAAVSVVVKVRRKGSEVALSWTPFPVDRPEASNEVVWEPPEGFEPGRVLSFYHQFGFTLEGYPLEFLEENRLGATGERGALEATLPSGSYLIVLRKPGFAEARQPVVVPSEPSEADGSDTPAGSIGQKFVLVPEDEIPPGFAYVPEGEVNAGGDARSWDRRQAETKRVPGFFLAELEVTTREWLEFVNDPEVLERTEKEGDEAGQAVPRSDIARALRPGLKIQIVPKYRESQYFKWNPSSRTWEPNPDVYGRRYLPELPGWPISCVSHLAAQEFADWRSRRGRWRYRLPSDLEWERAGRGVDRRPFPWGEYLVWSSSWSSKGIPLLNRHATRVGVTFADESPFGVRDMAGSNSEHTTGEPERGLRAYRGGSWNSLDEEDFHLASRNGTRPTERNVHFGVRLAADLKR